MSLFSKKPAKRLDLVFDIESDLVRVAAVEHGGEERPAITPLSSELIERSEHVDGAVFTERMLKAVGAAAEGAAKTARDVGVVRFDKMHFILSSPWVVAKLSAMEKRFDHEVAVTRSGVYTLIEKEKEKIAADFKVGDSAIIDAKLFEVSVNGYPVIEYDGTVGRTLAGTIAVSLGSRKIMRDIRSAAYRSVRASAEHFHASAFLRYAALRLLLPGKDFIWLQIHGELTDVIAARGDACILTGSFPFGTETFIRKISHSLHESEDGIRSSLSLHAKDHLTNAQGKAVEESSLRVLREWTNGLGELLAACNGPTPSLVYAAMHDDDAFFGRALADMFPNAVIKSGAEIIPDIADPSFELYGIALNGAFEL